MKRYIVVFEKDDLVSCGFSDCLYIKDAHRDFDFNKAYYLGKGVSGFVRMYSYVVGPDWANKTLYQEARVL